MEQILKAISLIRETQKASLGAQIEVANFIDTLTRDEKRAVIRVVDAENLGHPKNLVFDYQRQEWLV